MTTPLIMLLLLVAPYVVLGAAGMMRGREVFDASTRGCLGLTLQMILLWWVWRFAIRYREHPR
jgi:ammonia channel protein AmtB